MASQSVDFLLQSVSITCDPFATTATPFANEEPGITKNGMQKFAAAPKLDLEKWKSDKKITDEELLKILELPLAKPSSAKSKNKKKKKKKTAKKPAAKEEESESEDDEEDSDEESDE